MNKEHKEWLRYHVKDLGLKCFPECSKEVAKTIFKDLRKDIKIMIQKSGSVLPEEVIEFLKKFNELEKEWCKK